MRRIPPKRRSQPLEVTVAVQGEYVTLGQLLKIAGVISTGGAARGYLAESAVLVNGEAEQKRGRKLRVGDVVLPPGHGRIRLIAEAGFLCPVCGYSNLQEPPHDAAGAGSGEICPCCGIEFGKDDAGGPSVYEPLRAAWISAGMPWLHKDITRKPSGWSATVQLEKAGLTTQTRSEGAS